MVKEAWGVSVKGSPMFQVSQKLKNVKAHLKNFNRVYFGGLPGRVNQAREGLHRCQAAVLNNPSNEALISQEQNSLKHFLLMLKYESMFYQQKSRVDWLKYEDSNTGFFSCCDST